MDLDQIIHDADPARELTIDVPEPRYALGPRHRVRMTVVSVGVVAICAAIVVLALQLHGGSGVRTPSVLPLSSTTPLRVGSDVVPGTAQIVATVPDPDGGPGWGLRTYETRSGMTCVQAGRTKSGLIGGIGVDGAYDNDRMFHPFPISRLAGIGDCEPNDAHGHAFINIDAVNTAMSAAEQTCLKRDDALPREHCPTSALRDVYFGLLGPDATSITYVGPGGRQVTTPTRGLDGAYLIVRPLATGTCSAMRRLGGHGPSACDYDTQGYGLGAAPRSGEITTVRYRDGHACHLPAPEGVVVRIAQCPVVGYVPVTAPKYNAATIAAPVSVRELPARFYCARPGIYRPADLAIPCDGNIPKGYRRQDFSVSKHGVPSTDPGQNLLIYVSWTAHGAVDSIDHSTYSISIQNPKGCQSGGQGTGTGSVIHPGQQVTRSLFVFTNCRGMYSGQVTYTPNLGPGGENSAPAGGTYRLAGTYLVGKFSFRIP